MHLRWQPERAGPRKPIDERPDEYRSERERVHDEEEERKERPEVRKGGVSPRARPAAARRRATAGERAESVRRAHRTARSIVMSERWRALDQSQQSAPAAAMVRPQSTGPERSPVVQSCRICNDEAAMSPEISAEAGKSIDVEGDFPLPPLLIVRERKDFVLRRVARGLYCLCWDEPTSGGRACAICAKPAIGNEGTGRAARCKLPHKPHASRRCRVPCLLRRKLSRRLLRFACSRPVRSRRGMGDTVRRRHGAILAVPKLERRGQTFPTGRHRVLHHRREGLHGGTAF